MANSSKVLLLFSRSATADAADSPIAIVVVLVLLYDDDGGDDDDDDDDGDDGDDVLLLINIVDNGDVDGVDVAALTTVGLSEGGVGLVIVLLTLLVADDVGSADCINDGVDIVVVVVICSAEC